MRKNLLILTLVSTSSLFSLPLSLSHTHTHVHSKKACVSFCGGASLVAQMVKNLLIKCRTPRFISWVRKIPWRREWLPTPVFFPHPEFSVSLVIYMRKLLEKQTLKTAVEARAGHLWISVTMTYHHESQGKARTLRTALGLPWRSIG